MKRDRLNKIIFRHQENRTVDCKTKIEVDVGNGSIFNPKLSLILHPYGIEEDRGRYATLEVGIGVQKKAPKLKASTNVKISLIISKIQSEEINFVRIESLDLRVFYIKHFLSHQVLRESKSETVEITIRAECKKGDL